MDLSDDSFAWSDASNDSSVMALDIKQEKHDEESDSSFNRKAQENTQSPSKVQERKKAKKRKHTEPEVAHGSDEEKPKHIKLEPDSDFDAPKKKKKKKHNDDIPHSQDTQESTDYDDSYLNYRVKQEQMSFAEPAQVKSKKKKRHKIEGETIISEEFTIEKHEIESTIEENHAEDNSNVNEELTAEKHEIDSTIKENHAEDSSNVKEEFETKKKKKKKKETHTSNDDFEASDDNFKAKKKTKSKIQEKGNKSKSFNESNASQIEEISCINSSTAVNHFLDDNHVEESNDHVNKESAEIESNLEQDTSKSKRVKEISKISDRLRFEDEDSVDFNTKENVEDTNLSKQLKQFLNARKELSLIKSIPQSKSIITEDDEIWIITAPHELSIKDFKDINMKLDTKSKLKLNGQAYDSITDNSIQKIPILSYSNNKAYVQNIPVMGSINLRKRIPKAHIPEENILINHQPNFIPLPETKCRHPLFGINYKKATKIPPSVAERLNNTDVTPTVNGERERRKKHKKEKRQREVEEEVEDKLLDETPEVSHKKKRKRKSSIKEEPVSKKAKYIKEEPESGDVWESEQAIEKNLFDF